MCRVTSGNSALGFFGAAARSATSVTLDRQKDCSELGCNPDHSERSMYGAVRSVLVGPGWGRPTGAPGRVAPCRSQADSNGHPRSPDEVNPPYPLSTGLPTNKLGWSTNP